MALIEHYSLIHFALLRDVRKECYSQLVICELQITIGKLNQWMHSEFTTGANNEPLSIAFSNIAKQWLLCLQSRLNVREQAL